MPIDATEQSVYGGDGNDSISGGAYYGDIVVYGDAGNDTIYGK